MSCERNSSEALHSNRIHTLIAFAVLAFPGLCFPNSSAAQQQDQKTFRSASEATSALIGALRANDETGLLAILGPDAKDIISSGDPVEDKNDRDKFVQEYHEMHRLVVEPDGNTTLYLGA